MIQSAWEDISVHSRFQPASLSLSLSLSHTHTHTRTLSLTLSHSQSRLSLLQPVSSTCSLALTPFWCSGFLFKPDTSLQDDSIDFVFFLSEQSSIPQSKEPFVSRCACPIQNDRLMLKVFVYQRPMLWKMYLTASINKKLSSLLLKVLAQNCGMLIGLVWYEVLWKTRFLGHSDYLLICLSYIWLPLSSQWAPFFKGFLFQILGNYCHKYPKRQLKHFEPTTVWLISSCQDITFPVYLWSITFPYLVATDLWGPDSGH